VLYYRRAVTMVHAEITDKIIKAFFHVYNTLGYGFLGEGL
jgi:hypothetical protein